MKPSATRLLAALGLLVAAPFARADALDDARTALAGGDFATAKAKLDTYLTTPGSVPRPDDARVLRAFARLGIAVETDVPAALRSKLGANVAAIDFGSGDLALRLPRSFAYFNTPAFTISGTSYQYGPAINLYETGGAQPSISFENNGSSDYALTLVVSQPGKTQPDFDSTLYLDGMPLGYANAINEFPFQVFVPPLFELSPGIPKPFDLDLSVPSRYLATGANANSFTVTLPPKSNFTFGLVVSTGDIRLTPAEKLPSTIRVQNGKAGGINPPQLARGANLSNLFTVAGQLETSSLAPAIADLEAVTSEVRLVLHPEETGSAIDTIVAYPDVQLLLFELKFMQGFRRLSSSYNFSSPSPLPISLPSRASFCSRTPPCLHPTLRTRRRPRTVSWRALFSSPRPTTIPRPLQTASGIDPRPSPGPTSSRPPPAKKPAFSAACSPASSIL